MLEASGFGSAWFRPQPVDFRASPGNTALTTAPIQESTPGDLCLQIRDNSLSLCIGVLGLNPRSWLDFEQLVAG